MAAIRCMSQVLNSHSVLPSEITSKNRDPCFSRLTPRKWMVHSNPAAFVSLSMAHMALPLQAQPQTYSVVCSSGV